LSRPILVFDSGIGGLSVLTEIRKQLPQQACCYLFDNARLPYGELSEEELISGCVELVAQLVQRVDAAIVVIACNTASTLVLPALRARLNIPVVGVVPAVKPAARLSRKKHIGLLATPGTIKRPYTHELIESFASDCKVELFGSSELVMMAERKAAREDIDLRHLANILAPIVNADIDVLVLGCTHFPMLRAELETILGKGVSLLDSGEAIANRVVSQLAVLAGKTGSAHAEHKISDTVSLNDERRRMGELSAFYTKIELTEGLGKTLAEYGFTSVTRISVNG
jgi:glutamate racemase